MNKVKIRTPFNYDVRAAGRAAALSCDPEKDRTLQSQAQDADINVIMKRYGQTGVLPQGHRVPSYGDFTGISDFREALEMVQEANRAFMRLPAELRFKLGNDPAQFVEFCQDEKNLPELRKYGFAVPEKVPEDPDSRPATKGDLKQLQKDRTRPVVVKKDEKNGELDV